MSLDNFSRHQSAREHVEHRQLVLDAIGFLSSSISISSIAARGTRLLAELLAEEERHTQISDSRQLGDLHGEKQRSHGGSAASKSSEKSLNVSAFVKKFCAMDQPPPGNSPIATHMPLWLQQETSSQSYSDARRGSQDMYKLRQVETGITPLPTREYLHRRLCMIPSIPQRLAASMNSLPTRLRKPSPTPLISEE